MLVLFWLLDARCKQFLALSLVQAMMAQYARKPAVHMVNQQMAFDAASAAWCRILDVPNAQAGTVAAVQPGVSLPAVAAGLISIAAILLLVATRQ